MKALIFDPFGAAADPELPALALALDPMEAKDELKRGLPSVTGPNGKLRLDAIRVTRHKPGKRCVVEYDLHLERADFLSEPFTLIGKTRARRFGKEGFELLKQVWDAGFQEQSPDGISVPEPIGVIPRFRMWFQRKVPAQTAAAPLAGANGPALGRRIAEAIHKLHLANVPTSRRHLIGDELRILNECLAKVAALQPALAARLERVKAGCERLAASVPPPKLCGIHRDFYPAQVLVSESHLHLIDFDLYCLGDPALDAGNFLGHTTEEGLREPGKVKALEAAETALAERFCELSGESVRFAVEAYKTLTLVRHIYLTTQFPGRSAFTLAVLETCERRLGSAQ